MYLVNFQKKNSFDSIFILILSCYFIFSLKRFFISQKTSLIEEWYNESPLNGLWSCDLCDKKMHYNTRLRHNNSNTHSHKKIGIVVREYEIIQPEIDEVDYILDDVFKCCSKKFFHSFEYSCVYDSKYRNLTNIDEVILKITHGYMKFKCECFGLNKKNQNCTKKLDIISKK